MSRSSNLFLLLLFIITLLPPQVKAQSDTFRVIIPDVYVDFTDEGMSVDIPVKVSYGNPFLGLSLHLGWDPEVLVIDTVTYGPAFTDLHPSNRVTTVSYGDGVGDQFTPADDAMSLNHVVNTSIDDTSLTVVPLRLDSTATFATLRFTIAKFDGIAEIDVLSDYMSFTVVEYSTGTPISAPVTVSTGTITYNDEAVRTRFWPPAPMDTFGRVCVEWISRGSGPIADFDLTLAWRDDQFSLDSIVLGDNPLQLGDNELIIDPGGLRLLRDPARIDTLPYLPFGTKLMDLCFTPTAVDSRSYLDARRRVDPYFATFFRDTFYGPAPYELLAGDLYLPGRLATDTVGIALRPSDPNGTEPAAGCVDVVTTRFVDVSSFRFAAEWSAEYALDTFLIFPGSLGNGNLQITSQDDDELRLAFAPDSTVNRNILPGTPLARLCFTGFRDACDVLPVELSARRSRTTFRRRIDGLTGEVAVPYRVRSGYAYAPGGADLSLALDTVTLVPGETRADLTLTNTYDRCFDQYGFVLRYDTEQLRALRASLRPELRDNYVLRREFSPSGSGDAYVLSYRGAASPPPPLPAGPVATFPLVRRGTADTVAVDLAPLVTDSLYVTLNDTLTVATAVRLTGGRLVFLDTASSVTDPTWAGDLIVYPNPTDGLLTIAGLSGEARITVFDAAGRRVLNSESVSELDLTGLPPAPYWLRISYRGKAVVRRVIKR